MSAAIRIARLAAVALVLVGLPGCSSPSAQPAQSSRQQPGAAVNPITVEQDSQVYPNGRFARLSDPEGNPIQLWQPGGKDPG